MKINKDKLLKVIKLSAQIILENVNYNNVIVGVIVPQLPGLTMTNAIRDTMRGDLVSDIC